MFKLILLLVCVFLGPVCVAEPLKFGMGMSLETRVEKEVNPGFSDLKSLGVLFEEVRSGAWSGIAELGQENGDTSSGGLKIATQSTSLQAWGRYNFLEPDHWSPFAAAGAGVFFDRVTSSYHDLSDVHSGRRGMAGLGGGLTNVFWKYLLIEGEVRGALIQDRRDPGLSVILRAGVQL